MELKPISYVLATLLAVLCIAWSVSRDLHIENQYPGDLRNRVVGSRMQMDGIAPYFHHWKQGDGLRYFDWDNTTTTLKVANVTATPFFHQLLYPIANLPQRTISKWWLLLEYLALFLITCMGLLLAKQEKQRWAVIVTAVIFLQSYAWLTHVGMGQMYISIPLLSMLFYYLACVRPPSVFSAFFAGIVAAALILIRPNAVLFLLPFVLLAYRYAARFRMILCASFVLFLLMAFSSADSRFYWSQYRLGMQEQLKLHQDLSPALQHNQPLPPFERVEGWDKARIREAEKYRFYKPNYEHGNVFVLLNAGLHVKTPLWVLVLLFTGFAGLICGIFFFTARHAGPLHPFSAALLGTCIYMASDIFSPIHRFHYNSIQWIFPLMLIASGFSARMNKWWLAGILAGLFFNSIPVSFFPMERTLGEFMVYGSVLGILITFKPAWNNVREPLL